ncbi:hypothetical protein RN001_014012 [Aquatica leii]|uniref:Uncharacterized protein n=1 Tax=Aquatica leii TaxID=1421715 RepID=A0AAN7SCN3_9COLE|nr:hypothetical protein RN001_014012 [Aquatica leii]
METVLAKNQHERFAMVQKLLPPKMCFNECKKKPPVVTTITMNIKRRYLRSSGTTNKMKLAILGLFLFVLYVNAKPQYPTGVGYYWRDFDGSFYPSDAYEYTPNGYIGQVHAFGALIPGHIDKTRGYIEFVYNEQPYSSNKELKILSTTDTTQFEWVRANSNNVRNFMSKKFFVRGGFDSLEAQKSIIGRTLESSRAGVIYFMRQPALLQYVEDKKALEANEYEVLAIH